MGDTFMANYGYISIWRHPGKFVVIIPIFLIAPLAEKNKQTHLICSSFWDIMLKINQNKPICEPQQLYSVPTNN